MKKTMILLVFVVSTMFASIALAQSENRIMGSISIKSSSPAQSAHFTVASEVSQGFLTDCLSGTVAKGDKSELKGCSLATMPLSFKVDVAIVNLGKLYHYNLVPKHPHTQHCVFKLVIGDEVANSKPQATSPNCQIKE